MAQHNTYAPLTFPSKRIRLPAVVVALLMPAIVFPPAIEGNFDDRVSACNRDDYAAAHTEWRPLADQGHASV